MITYAYKSHNKFELTTKPKPELLDPRDAIVRVTMGSICSSDLHIKHGSVPRAVPGITVGHEMVGIVESIGSDVTKVKPGDRVTVNVETFLQKKHSPQKVSTLTVTLSPGFTFVTSLPILSTIPTIS